MTATARGRASSPGWGAAPRPRRRWRWWAFGLLVVLVAVAVVVVVAGQWAQGRVQTAGASRIEQQLPGSTATVRISSFPFLVRLAASGTVARLQADIDNVRGDPSPVTFDQVQVDVRDLRLRRDDLLHRRATIESIRTATLTATVTQSSLDDSLHLPITLGAGRVSLDGVTVPVELSVIGRQVVLTGPAGVHASFALPSVDLLPCVPTLQIEPGSLHLGCTVHQLPAVVSGPISF